MPRHQEILLAAEKLFFERSFDGVGVDDIGKAAGTSGSAIYRHFSGKDEILAALFSRMLDELLVQSGKPGSDPYEELDSLLRGFIELAMSHEKLAAIWVREQRSLADPYRREHFRRLHRFSDRWVECLGRCYQGRSREELVVAARAVQTMLLSEALRPPETRRLGSAPELMLQMARASLTALNAPGTERG
ncbi:TetR/AcrR family transcriptional regulator [Streptomyces sp. NBC_01320]|uniref:TetR/AcrR family transcriptional regulator n=1 Tax=Streptomyces sp. NBC_01320 TaxID=2903824 RepID=UPI002E0D4089|nr:TetR/AcrR family transcriptional regulator [Streptomyces sp. NBC_01320]